VRLGSLDRARNHHGPSLRRRVGRRKRAHRLSRKECRNGDGRDLASRSLHSLEIVLVLGGISLEHGWAEEERKKLWGSWGSGVPCLTAIIADVYPKLPI
jgi:hypothetical protein